MQDLNRICVDCLSQRHASERSFPHVRLQAPLLLNCKLNQDVHSTNGILRGHTLLHTAVWFLLAGSLHVLRHHPLPASPLPIRRDNAELWN